MKKTKLSIIIGLLCMILTISICIQLKTVIEAGIDGVTQLTDSNLKKSLIKWKATYVEDNEKLKETDKQLADLRNNTLDNGSDSERMEKLKKYQVLLGTTNVSGDGVVITVADNNKAEIDNSFSSLYISDSLVHDGNLVSIVNELKAAGAEAISINDKRITNETAITCAGNIIQVNGEKVGSPFIIKAIGEKDLLYGEITKKDGTVYKLKKYGVITNVAKEDGIKINKKI